MGVLQFGDIGFVPALPQAHQAAIFDLPMGLLTKIPLAVSGTRLGLAPFDDLLIERRGQHDLYVLCFPFDLDLMVGFVGGDFAWKIEAAGQAAAVGHGTMTRWGGERYVRGAYAGARDVLRQPVGERIRFAGEALAGAGLVQTAAVARLSGAAVARQVVAVLSGSG